MQPAGKYNTFVRLEKPSQTVDPDYGTPTGAWELVSDWQRAEWQDVLPSKGEQQANGIEISNRPVRVRMGYREDVRAGMRIIRLDRGGRIAEIVTEPAEMGQRGGIEFMAQTFSSRGDA